MIRRRMSRNAAVGIVGLLCTLSANAQNLIANGDFSTGDLSGWTTTPNSPTTITYDGSEGNPVGSALLDRNSVSGTANANYIYKTIPVASGRQYKLDAQWKGDLYAGNTGRNWAEVFVGFSNNPDPGPNGSIMYKKASDGGPNQPPADGWGWESILLSPDGGPADGIFTATDNYMTVMFNLGGRDASSSAGPGFYYLDNVSVTPWPPSSRPVFTDIVPGGGNLILRGTNGPPQGAYEMSQSADVSRPAGTWAGVGINTFDPDGRFSYTNTLPGDAAGFYSVRVISSVPGYPPVITAQPTDLATSVGDDASFDVTATGSEPLTYHWYHNTNTLLASGPSDTLVVADAQVADSGTYSVIVSNLLGTVPSEFATLTVTNSTQPPRILVQPSDQTATIGQTVDFSVTADGANPLHYRWYHNTNTVLTAETNSTLTLLNVNTNQAGAYSVTISNLYGSANSTFASLNVIQELLAFPEAEGYGKNASGGRGGAVYEVTTLNPTGSGSLGAAIGASGPRTVVFRVAGTIDGDFDINNNDITIAGQTAPGDGICIKGNLGIGADNVIIRYIRVRAEASGDALGGRYNQDIMLDHVSASWSSDEVLSLYHNHHVTIQWCIISEACSSDHRFGGIWGNNYGTYHHNLIAHNDSRNPRWASGCKYNDYRNNVLYNWGYNSCYGAEAQQVGSTEWNFSTINMIANYYRAGPATAGGVRDRIAEPSARSSGDKGSWYVSDNYVNGYPAVTADNWLGIDGSDYIQLGQPWPAMPINQQTPRDAYSAVLAHAGCSKPNRDSIDTRIVHEVAQGTTTYGNNGIITVPGDVGGWPTLSSGTPPPDTDHDGMPDGWEDSHGLNPTDPSDRNTVGANGYTMLEIYLNELGAF